MAMEGPSASRPQQQMSVGMSDPTDHLFNTGLRAIA